jgi:hypothetical protein
MSNKISGIGRYPFVQRCLQHHKGVLMSYDIWVEHAHTYWPRLGSDMNVSGIDFD